MRFRGKYPGSYRLLAQRALRTMLCIVASIAYFQTAAWGSQMASSSASDQVVVIDSQGSGPVFDGIGAVSAGASSRLLVDYPEPQRTQILDYLFKPGYGAALQHLKVEIGADVDSTDGSEPSSMRSPTDHNYSRGYEWWLMEEARKRNPNIVLDSLPWGAPGWVGNGRFYSNDMADYMADFLEGAKKINGLDFAYTGVWNERPQDNAYVKLLTTILKEHGLSAKVVCCDIPAGRRNGWEIIKDISSDADLSHAISVIGVHYPWQYNNATTPDDARDVDKPLWSSEDQPNSGGGPYLSRDWSIGGRLLAKLYNLNYLQGGFTATEIWSPVTSYYDILAAPGSGLMMANTPWSGSYEVQGAIWATAHTTQFTQPGWIYDNPSCGYLAKGGSFVTYLSPDRKNWSTVIESIDAREPQTVHLEFKGELSPGLVEVWETNSHKNFVHVAELKPVDHSLTLTVDPDSLYTLTNTSGQGKGDAVPPHPANFPMPYSDDFESTAAGRAPKYLSDQDGAFEVHTCRQRTGNCLEQVITDVPIPWGPLPDPFTLAGDEQWKDYQVSADVEIPLAGVGTLFGRIDSADVFRDGRALYPSGYGLLMTSSGEWRLVSTAYGRPMMELAHGEVDQKPKQWHRLQLRFEGGSITAFIDGQQVAGISDSTHGHGMFSLGSNWTRVQFDDLKVEPVEPQSARGH